jgi:hypothetical protein
VRGYAEEFHCLPCSTSLFLAVPFFFPRSSFDRAQVARPKWWEKLPGMRQEGFNLGVFVLNFELPRDFFRNNFSPAYSPAKCSFRPLAPSISPRHSLCTLDAPSCSLSARCCSESIILGSLFYRNFRRSQKKKS